MALLIVDPGQRLFQFCDQRLDAFFVRYLTCDCLVSLDPLFEARPVVFLLIHGNFSRERSGAGPRPAGSRRPGFTSVGANRLEASVQGPWTSWGPHTRQGS